MSDYDTPEKVATRDAENAAREKPDPPKPLVFADITAHESRYHHGGYGQSADTMAKPAVQDAARALVAAMEAFSLECEIAQTERTLESCQAGVNDAMNMLAGLRRLRS